MVALTMTFADEPMAKTMSFQREYAEAYDRVAQQFRDWAFTLTTSILYYNDYDLIDEDTRKLYRKGMAAPIPHFAAPGVRISIMSIRAGGRKPAKKIEVKRHGRRQEG